MGAVAAPPALVTETARDTLPAGTGEVQKSVEPSLAVLPAMDEQAPTLGMAGAMGLKSGSPSRKPRDNPGGPGQSCRASPSCNRRTAEAPVPSEVADPPSETISPVTGVIPLRATEDVGNRLEASATKEALSPSEFSTVFSLPVAAPVTLTLALATLSPLKPRQARGRSGVTRMPKIPALARAQLRLKVVKEARAIVPPVAAFDDPKSPAPAAAAVDVPEPMMLVVSLDAQKLDIYRGIKHISSAKISSGMPGYDTKMGVFSILEKKRRHHSNLDSGAPMPFMQRLTRSGTALHAGAIPGYPASHGCVRLPYSFAPKLFEMTSVGQNVAVTRGRPVPTRIAHPNLFQLSLAEAASGDGSFCRVPRLLTDAVAGAAEGDVQTRAASFRSDAPLRMLVTRRTAHDRVMAVQYMLADLGYLARQNFIGNLGPATGNAIRAFQKANGLQATGAFTDELVSQVYRAAGQTEPPEGHLFVRQGFKRVFDLPISFRDPRASLGTHVFTVVKREGDEAKPAWMAVSLEGGEAAARSTASTFPTRCAGP